MTLQELKDNWQDTPEFHQQVNTKFTELVNEDEVLNRHRTFVEQYAYGFGERSFGWAWKEIVGDLPNVFNFLEIGCYRGATLSLIQLISMNMGKRCNVFGVTPLNGTGVGIEQDYGQDIINIHNHFELPLTYKLYVGLSENPEIIAQASENSYDCIYVDGGHSFETALSDLQNYSPMVKTGGYLVIDDSCNDMKQPWGFFQGIGTVTSAVLQWKQDDDNFEFIGNVVHLRIYRRTK